MQMCPQCRELGWERYNSHVQEDMYYLVKNGWRPSVGVDPYAMVQEYTRYQLELVNNKAIDDLMAMENILVYAITLAKGDLVLGLEYAASSFYRDEVGFFGAKNYRYNQDDSSNKFRASGFHWGYVGGKNNKNQGEHFIGEAFIGAILAQFVPGDVAGYNTTMLVAFLQDPGNDIVSEAEKNLGYLAADWVGHSLNNPEDTIRYLHEIVETIRNGQ